MIERNDSEYLLTSDFKSDWKNNTISFDIQIHALS